MFYAWNADGTIGMVISVHTVQPANISEGSDRSLDLAVRDAFVMIEIGEEIPTNFCVTSIQQIPVSTVLESTAGQIGLQRQADAWTVLKRCTIQRPVWGTTNGVTVNDH